MHMHMRAYHAIYVATVSCARITCMLHAAEYAAACPTERLLRASPNRLKADINAQTHRKLKINIDVYYMLCICYGALVCCDCAISTDLCIIRPLKWIETRTYVQESLLENRVKDPFQWRCIC